MDTDNLVISVAGNDFKKSSSEFVVAKNTTKFMPRDRRMPKTQWTELHLGVEIKTPVWHGLEGKLHDKQLIDAGIRLVSVFDADTDTLIYMCPLNDTPAEDIDPTKVTPFKHVGSTLIHRYRLDLLSKSGEVLDSILISRAKDVLITLPDGAIGDTLAWFPACDKFQRKHNCKVTAVVPKWFIELAAKQYPNIRMITYDEIEEETPFAMYQLGVFFGNDTWHQPIDFKFTGLHKTVCNILGVSDAEECVKLDLSAPRQIKEKYVCIAAQASSKTKCWNNPWGWYELVKYLKAQGYRVLCVDKSAVNNGNGIESNVMPPGVEDFTGAFPLQERVNLIKDADFFIGVSSGLSWLAWSCKVPVVLISGFTLPFNEFETPYRVINYNGCTGCWHDMRELFDHGDYCWCPRHKGTPRQFECSKLISPKHVLDVIKTIPSYRPDNATLTLDDLRDEQRKKEKPDN